MLRIASPLVSRGPRVIFEAVINILLSDGYPNLHGVNPSVLLASVKDVFAALSGCWFGFALF